MSQTLGYHRKMAAAVFGEGSAPVKYLDGKIAESPNGADEEVMVSEETMVQLLSSMWLKESNPLSDES